MFRRDLYVQNVKSIVYAAYGIKEQARVVGEVLGLVVHNYILVDMYVFRDLIDLLGRRGYCSWRAFGWP